MLTAFFSSVTAEFNLAFIRKRYYFAFKSVAYIYMLR